MPSLGRFKVIFWNQDSLTRQGGTTTWGPRLFRIQAPFLLFHALRLAAVRMPGQFSGSRKCNHGIFPRLSAPLGAAPSQDIINVARNAAAAAIVICCCSGNKQPREEKPLPSQLCSRSRLMSLDLFRTKARPSTPRQSNTQCPLRFRLMSCLLPIRPHRTGFKASSCCKAGEERCVSSFASIRWMRCIWFRPTCRH